jgi:hypothetical protein
MELSGFTETQMTVRDAAMKLCGNFPDVRGLVLPTVIEV